jgi:hypothetical protein
MSNNLRYHIIQLDMRDNRAIVLSPRVGHRNCPKNLRLSKYTDMTIHWKALEEHFLMVLVFRFTHFRGIKSAFSVLLPKHRNCPKNLRLSKYTDMTIHWKALEVHFLVVQSVFQFKFLGRKMHFLKFSPKTSFLKET